MPSIQTTYQTHLIEFQPNEHIVSVFVESDSYYPVKCHFLVFNQAADLRYPPPTALNKCFTASSMSDSIESLPHVSGRMTAGNSRKCTFTMSIHAVMPGPGMIPSEKQLYAMGVEQIKCLRLTEVLWQQKDSKLDKVAFRFSNDMATAPDLH